MGQHRSVAGRTPPGVGSPGVKTRPTRTSILHWRGRRRSRALPPPATNGQVEETLLKILSRRAMGHRTAPCRMTVVMVLLIPMPKRELSPRGSSCISGRPKRTNQSELRVQIPRQKPNQRIEIRLPQESLTWSSHLESSQKTMPHRQTLMHIHISRSRHPTRELLS